MPWSCRCGQPKILAKQLQMRVALKRLRNVRDLTDRLAEGRYVVSSKGPERAAAGNICDRDADDEVDQE